MMPYPHIYTVAAASGPEGTVGLSSEGLAAMESAPPVEFGGPGDRWSPETLLVASVADCFALTFRAIARARGLAWRSLEVEVVGTLDQVERQARFIRFQTSARLRLAPDGDRERAEQALHRAEATCLIANSLSAERHLDARVEIAES